MRLPLSRPRPAPCLAAPGGVCGGQDCAGSTRQARSGGGQRSVARHHRGTSPESAPGNPPNMRSIQVFGKPVTGWQVLPADAPNFEEAALHAVADPILANDPRIGKIPRSRRASKLTNNKRTKNPRSQLSHREKIARSGESKWRDEAQSPMHRGLRGGKPPRLSRRAKSPVFRFTHIQRDFRYSNLQRACGATRRQTAGAAVSTWPRASGIASFPV